MNRLQTYFCVVNIFLFSTCAQANWSHRPLLGLGYTDNANYEKRNTDADFYWQARASSTYSGEKEIYNLWLNYRDYFQENQNDVLGYRLSRVQEMQSQTLGDYDWNLAVGGLKFSEGSPGTKEESFDNIYLETSWLKSWESGGRLEFDFEPLYQFKYFPGFDSRKDNTISGHGSMSWRMNPKNLLQPFAELAIVSSSLSLYSKNYFEFGSSWSIFHRPDLKYTLLLSSRLSTFPHRKVSDQTAVSDRKGRIKVISQNENESQSFFQVQGSAVKIFKSLELRGTVELNSQNSKSGDEDYTEWLAQVTVLFPF